jgi:hypothetical protein
MVITIRGGDTMKKLWIVPVVVTVWLLGFTSQKDTYAGAAQLQALLDGFHQVPPVHTDGKATFTGQINEDGTITFTLTYSGLTEPVHVQFADVHFGQEQNTGGILFFLCSNQATAPTQANPVSVPVTGTDTHGVTRDGVVVFNGPVAVPGFGTADGLPTCPDSGTVTGTIGPDAVVDVGAPFLPRGGQGILPGELDKALEAIRSGQTYVQIHTDAFPAGELRRQIQIDEEHN